MMTPLPATGLRSVGPNFEPAPYLTVYRLPITAASEPVRRRCRYCYQHSAKLRPDRCGASSEELPAKNTLLRIVRAMAPEVHNLVPILTART